MNLPTPDRPLPSTEALPAQSVPEQACANCGQPATGDGRFCARCGQLVVPPRFTPAHLLHEVFHLFTHVESGFWYTLKELAVRPGFMQRDYLAGRRGRFQKPFSAFFVACTVTALGQFALNSLVARWYGIEDSATGYFRHYFSLVQVGLLPLYALITWLLFRRQRFNYAETAVVTAYSLSLLLYATLALNLLRLIWPQLDTKYLELPLIVAYNVVTNRHLFPSTSRWVLVGKSLVICSACFALATLVAKLGAHWVH